MKSQAAFEFIVLASVMMGIFVVFFAITSENIIDMNDARRDKVAQDIMDTVVAELELAQQSMDGYTRNFTMPEYVEGNPYEIHINNIGPGKNILTLMYMDKLYNQQVSVTLEGASNAVYKGINQVKKTQGKITVLNGDDPCNKVTTVGPKSYCLGGRCYCQQGNYAFGELYMGNPDNICTKENDFDLAFEPALNPPVDECMKGCVNFDWCNPPPGIEPDESRPYSPAVGVLDIADKSATLVFTTNESAKAAVRYGILNNEVCPQWENMVQEAKENSLMRNFRIRLTDLIAETAYCFRIDVGDQKGASQRYSDEDDIPVYINNEKKNTFATVADISPPEIKSVDVFIYFDELPLNEFNYMDKARISANVIDDSGVNFVKATIKQKDNGYETMKDVEFRDYDSSCDPDSSPYDNIYITCFDIDKDFAKYSSYAADKNTLFYASYDSSTAAEKGGMPLPLSGGAEIADARYGSGVKLDAADKLAYDAAGILDTGNGTVEFWFKPVLNTGSIQYLFYLQGSSGSLSLSRLGNSLTFLIKSPSGTFAVDSTSLALGDRWHFVALTWENLNSGKSDAKMRMFIDGNQAADSEEDVNINLIAGDAFYVGSYPPTEIGVDNAQSIIDQFRILDQAKSNYYLTADYETINNYDIYLSVQDDAIPDKHSRLNILPGQYPGTGTFEVNYKAVGQ